MIHINRGRIEGDERLYVDYFAINPVYDDKMFRRRFRMRHDLFFRLCKGVMVDNDSYFLQKKNCAGTVGFSRFQKVTASLRVLCYGSSADSLDEYLRMSETVIIATVKRFCKSVIHVFGDEYLLMVIPIYTAIVRGLGNSSSRRGRGGFSRRRGRIVVHFE